MVEAKVRGARGRGTQGKLKLRTSPAARAAFATFSAQCADLDALLGEWCRSRRALRSELERSGVSISYISSGGLAVAAAAAAPAAAGEQSEPLQPPAALGFLTNGVGTISHSPTAACHSAACESSERTSRSSDLASVLKRNEEAIQPPSRSSSAPKQAPLAVALGGGRSGLGRTTGSRPLVGIGAGGATRALLGVSEPTSIASLRRGRPTPKDKAALETTLKSKDYGLGPQLASRDTPIAKDLASMLPDLVGPGNLRKESISLSSDSSDDGGDDPRPEAQKAPVSTLSTATLKNAIKQASRPVGNINKSGIHVELWSVEESIPTMRTCLRSPVNRCGLEKRRSLPEEDDEEEIEFFSDVTKENAIGKQQETKASRATAAQRSPQDQTPSPLRQGGHKRLKQNKIPVSTTGQLYMAADVDSDSSSNTSLHSPGGRLLLDGDSDSGSDSSSLELEADEEWTKKLREIEAEVAQESMMHRTSLIDRLSRKPLDRISEGSCEDEDDISLEAVDNREATDSDMTCRMLSTSSIPGMSDQE